MLQQSEEAEKHAKRNEPQDLFQKIKAITKSFQLQFLQVKNEEGHTLTAKSEVIQRWKQYCEKLMTPDDHREARTHQLVQPTELEPTILRSEMENAFKRIKSRKAAGTDGIVAEMLKAAGELAITILHQICKGIWQTGKWPDD